MSFYELPLMLIVQSVQSKPDVFAKSNKNSCKSHITSFYDLFWGRKAHHSNPERGWQHLGSHWKSVGETPANLKVWSRRDRALLDQPFKTMVKKWKIDGRIGLTIKKVPQENAYMPIWGYQATVRANLGEVWTWQALQLSANSWRRISSSSSLWRVIIIMLLQTSRDGSISSLGISEISTVWCPGNLAWQNYRSETSQGSRALLSLSQVN